VGCTQLSVQRLDGPASTPGPNPSTARSTAIEVQNLAITAVDFDPPLNSNLAKLLDHISLLAVIENRGTQPARNISVHAQLFGIDSVVPLLETSTVIEHLVPGESRVVQFDQLPSIPVKTAYRLTISAHAVDGSALPNSSTRTYRIELTMPPARRGDPAR
jgi:hypothetical protein